MVEKDSQVFLGEWEYKVALVERNGKKMMISKAWSPRKVDARRIARKLQLATGLTIDDQAGVFRR